MKHLLFILTFLFFSVSAIADDIIITKKKEKIVCKVIEVATDIVKYKKIDMLDGATFSLAKKDIASIIWDNGNVEVFEESLVGTTAGNYNNYQNNGNNLKPWENGNNNQLWKNNLNNDQYRYYKQAKSVRDYGISASVIGGVMAIVGVGVGAAFYYDGGYILLYTAGSIGLGLTASGISCAVIGARRMKMVQQSYAINLPLYQKGKSKLNFGINLTGVGLAYNF